MITYTLTLANGDVFTITRKTPLRYWKSALMHKTPYGTTDYTGATWTKARS